MTAMSAVLIFLFLYGVLGEPISKHTWDVLNTTVEGRLVKGIAFAKPCFDDVHSAECQIVQENYTNESRFWFFSAAAPNICLSSI